MANRRTKLGRTGRAILAAAALAACWPAAECRAQAKDWDDSYYAKFTPTKFSGYRAANQPIDFKNVNEELLGASIFYETNRRRIQFRKRPFVYSPALRAAALGHCEDMVKYDFHAHENPMDPKKKTIVQRLALVGIERGAMAENIAYLPGRQYAIRKLNPEQGEVRIDLEHPAKPHTYVSFARWLLDGWMGSPGHRANILSDTVAYVGCAAVPYDKEGMTPTGVKFAIEYFKCCQDFASVSGPAARRE